MQSLTSINRLVLFVFGKNLFMKKFVFPFNNGVALVKDDKLCLSFIDSDGHKQICSEKIKSRKGWSIIFLRGLLYFFVGIFLYIKTLFLEENKNSRSEEEQSRAYKRAQNLAYVSNFLLLFAFILLAFLFGFIVLGFLPNYIVEKLLAGSSYYLQSLLVGLFRTVAIYLSFSFLRLSPFMHSLLRFNLSGQQLISDNKTSKASSLNFLNFLVNVCLISTFVVSFIAINVSWIANFFINLAIFLLLTGFVYEILTLVEKSKTRLVGDFAFITLWLVYLKPNITQIEVGKVAQIELERNADQKYEKEQVPLSRVFAEMETKLKAADRYEKSDAEWIVATILDVGRAQLKMISTISQEQERKIMSACLRRAKGEPLSSIFGFVDFYGNKIEVSKKVLSPRSETELLVEAALKTIKKQKLQSVLDLCTGSGAIAIAIKKNCQAKVCGSDISKAALAVAQSNAQLNDAEIEFVHSDLFSAFKKGRKFDIIVSNPPYIRSGDIEKLDIEVKDYDPRIALDGGADGLDFYKKIIQNAKKHLSKGSYLFFEVGQGQAGDVSSFMKESDFMDIKVLNDYNKIERIVYGRIG